MICLLFFFLMARMTGDGWLNVLMTFSTSRYCSVMRLCCLDELLNNDKLLVVISVILHDMSSKKVQ
jgi:hypothetical protein